MAFCSYLSCRVDILIHKTLLQTALSCSFLFALYSDTRKMRNKCIIFTHVNPKILIILIDLYEWCSAIRGV